MLEYKYFIIIAVTTILVIAVSVGQYLQHRWRLRKIRWRVHVNGTRGKSSVTRLIAAGLRAGSIRTCAKTTGTLPRMILSDGREYPIFRPGKPNISEQMRVVKAAQAHSSEALVVECMALLPYLQWMSESKMIQATHAVITNARADHLDVMGPGENHVAEALCGMIPVGGKLYTCEVKHLPMIQSACADRKTQCVHVAEEDIQKITAEELSQFSYIEHAENIALALKVCEEFGVKRATALHGMQNAEPDPGALTDHEIHFFGRKLFFVNGFAANDPESTEKIWNIALDKHQGVSRSIAVFNCRVDRPDRSLQLGKAFVDWKPPTHLVLMGSGTYLFAKAAVSAGFNYADIHFAENHTVEEIFELVLGLAGATAVIVGMGNIGGQGLEMAQYFKNRALV